MTWKDNFAGMCSAHIWPAYLKAKEDKRGYPNAIAFSLELYEAAIKAMENRNYNTKPGPGQDSVPKDKFMSMDVIYDDSFTGDQWELRWV